MHLHHEMGNRLVRGDSIPSIARWLLTKPNRGGLQKVGSSTLEKYLYALSKQVIEQRRAHPAASPEQIKAEVKVIQLQPENMPALQMPRQRGQKYQSIKSFISERVEKENRVTWLLGLLEHNYEQLERLRMVEEQYHHEKKLPTQAMGRARAQIVGKMIKILQELRKNEAQDLMRQRISSGKMPP